MANCGDPLIRFADNTVINMCAVVSVVPSSSDETFSRYEVTLASGESCTIHNEEREEGVYFHQMLYDDFLNKWHRALRPLNPSSLL